MMMDTSFLGGLLFSEVNMIPTVAIGSHETFTFAVEHEPKWKPSPKRFSLDRMDRIFLQRLHSVGLTGVFLRVNQMRHSLGLKELGRLTTPLDQLLPVVSILADLIPSDISLPLFKSMSALPETLRRNKRDDNGSYNNDDFHAGKKGYGYRIHNVQPLLSPCTICSNKKTSSWNTEQKTSVIIVAPPVGVSGKWTRSMIRALSMTKQSLEGYGDCLGRANCDVGFEVDWLTVREEDDDHFPPVVPSFIHREVSINLLDSAIRNPNTVIALIHCDSESNILATLGIEIFCISQSHRIPTFDSVRDLLYEQSAEGAFAKVKHFFDRDYSSRSLFESISRETINPEVVASQLINVLRRKSGGSKSSMKTDHTDSIEKRAEQVAGWVTSGLRRTITIVETAARLNRNNKWENLREMHKETSSAIKQALHAIDRILVDEDTEEISNTNNKDVREEIEVHDIFTVFGAWVVVISATFYVIMKDRKVTKRWRQHRHHHLFRNGGSFLDGIMSRLSDVDNGLDMLLAWAAAVTATNPIVESKNDPIGRAVSEEHLASDSRKDQQILQNSHSHNNHGNVRRRRKTKTARQ